MTKFFKKKRTSDPTEEAVARTFNKLNKKVTPSEVAEYLGIHPNTAKNRIERLEKKGYIQCEMDGRKKICKRKKKIPVD